MSHRYTSYTVFSYCVDYLHTLENIPDNDEITEIVERIKKSGFDQNDYVSYDTVKSYIDQRLVQSKNDIHKGVKTVINAMNKSPPQSPQQQQSEIENENENELLEPLPPPYADDQENEMPPPPPSQSPPQSPHKNLLGLDNNNDEQNSDDGSVINVFNDHDNDEKKRPKFAKYYPTRSLFKKVIDIKNNDIIDEIGLINKLDNPESLLRKVKK